MQQNTEPRSPPHHEPPPGEKTIAVSPTRARGAETGHSVRYVLMVSLAAVVAAFAIIYAMYFA